MHKLTGNRDAVLEVLRQTVFHLTDETGSVSAKSIGMKSLGVTSNPQWVKQRDTTVDLLQRAYEREHDRTMLLREAKLSAAPSESTAKDWYMPRDRTLAVFQAAMDEYLDIKTKSATGEQKKIKGKTSAKTVKKKAVPKIDWFFKEPPKKPRGEAMNFAGFEKYDNLDPGWIAVVWEKAKSLLRGKAKFIKHQKKDDFRFETVNKPEVTVALVSDWGGGNAAASAVAAQIRLLQPDHVIHLGDVYYAGTKHEIENRFLNMWNFWSTPATAGRSFALNSNHEMYGGGHGYFKTTLKTFKQPASYFNFGNEHWRFIGLDTGYVDHDLNAEQIEWLAAQLDGSAKIVLLSHHQPFSAFTDTDHGAKLRARVQPFLGKIYGWFWGHEHLCVAYGQHLGIKGRCIGHGCIPYKVPNTPSNNLPVVWLNRRQQSNGRGIHGFARLTLSGANLRVEYIDQDGTIAHTESF
jgi:Calcineurin-like phosphoesterase